MAEKLQVYLPVSPFHLNQKFGDNIPCIEDTPDIPLSQRKVVAGYDNSTCPVGYVKLYPLLGLQGHNGNDLMAGEQNCYAAADGQVIEMQTHPQNGLGLGIVTHDAFDLGEHGVHLVKIRYWHLKSFNVKVGDNVKAGDLIGVTDNTGFSAGDHLHWEGVPIDQDGHWTVVFPNNGYQGAIDLMPFCNMQFAGAINLHPQISQAIVDATAIVKQIPTIDAPPSQKITFLDEIKKVVQEIESIL